MSVIIPAADILQQRVHAHGGIGVAASGSLFTINSGRIMLYSLSGFVSVGIGAVATSIRFEMNPTVGANTPICADTVITSAALGRSMALTGVFADQISMPATEGAVQGQLHQVMLDSGSLDLIVTGGTTGTIKWFAIWAPIDIGAVLA